MVRRFMAVTCILVVTTLPDLASAQEGDTYLRDGFYIGFNVGAGGLAFEFGDWTTERETSAAFALRLGGALAPQFLLGGNLGGWSKEFDDGSTVTIVRISAEATVFPAGAMPGPGKGFFLRGGAGISRVEIEIPGLGTADDDGTALHAGTGYEWRIGDGNFHLGVALDWQFAFFENDVSADYWEGTLQFMWY